MISISAVIVAISTGILTEVTTSRVEADLSIHIASRGVGDAIFLGDCSRAPSSRDVLFIRLVDSAVEADLVGHLVSHERLADHVFCTGP